jgi:hypothetical protein
MSETTPTTEPTDIVEAFDTLTGQVEKLTERMRAAGEGFAAFGETRRR